MRPMGRAKERGMKLAEKRAAEYTAAGFCPEEAARLAWADIFGIDPFNQDQDRFEEETKP